MKNYIYILTLSILSLYSCHAQLVVNYDNFNNGPNEGKYFKDIDNNFTPFLGTWEWQDNNQIFRITLWKEEYNENENGNRPSFFWDEIKGHFELVEIGQSGGQFETTIYTSQRKIGQSNTDWFPVIDGASNNGINFEGLIYDNSVPYDPNYITGVRGNLILTIIPNSQPQQMDWKVTLPQGMYGTDQPTEFNIPTDIVLTKQF